MNFLCETDIFKLKVIFEKVYNSILGIFIFNSEKKTQVVNHLKYF